MLPINGLAQKNKSPRQDKAPSKILSRTPEKMKKAQFKLQITEEAKMFKNSWKVQKKTANPT